MANFKFIKGNIVPLTSHVSDKKLPYFKFIVQDIKTGGMYSFIKMKDEQTTQKCLDSLFKCNVDQGRLFSVLLHPYMFVLGPDNQEIPPVFQLIDIKELSVAPFEVPIKKAFTLNRRI